MTGRWRFRFDQTFRAYNPNGIEIQFSTRRAAAALAICILEAGKPVSRLDLAKWLWSSVPANQQMQSLRKALSDLRHNLQSAGGSPLEIHRQTCIWDSLGFDSNHAELLDDPQLKGTFLAEFRDEFFLQMRQDTRLGVSTSKVETTNHQETLESFRRVVQWSLERDPITAIDVLRSAPELGMDLPPNELRAATAPALHEMPLDSLQGAWATYFNAIVDLFRGEVLKSSKAFAASTRAGIALNDANLVAESMIPGVHARLVTGNTEEALRMADVGLAVLENHKSPSRMGRTLHARGLALCHLGRYKEGLVSFEMALNSPIYEQYTLERGHLLSHIALFGATNGEIGSATKRLEEAQAILATHPHWRLENACALTQGCISLRLGELERADKSLAIVERVGELIDEPSVAIYGIEMRAVLARMRREPEISKSFLEKSIKSRQRFRLVHTAWDVGRLRMKREL